MESKVPEVVLRLIEQGREVVPCYSDKLPHPDGDVERRKSPCISNPFENTASTIKKAEIYAEVYPNCNWAAAARKDTFLIVDDDACIMQPWIALQDGFDTFTVETSPGHRQYHFQQTPASQRLGRIEQHETEDKAFSIRFHNQIGLMHGVHPQGHLYRVVSAAEAVRFPESLYVHLKNFITKEKTAPSVSTAYDYGNPNAQEPATLDEAEAMLKHYGWPVLGRTDDKIYTVSYSRQRKADDQLDRTAITIQGSGFNFTTFGADDDWSGFRKYLQDHRGDKDKFSRRLWKASMQASEVKTENGGGGTFPLDGNSTSNTLPKPAVKEWAHDPVPGKKADFIFGPIELTSDDFSRKAGGLFPRSAVSLIGGPSGVGKTSLIWPALDKQSRGESWLEHPTFGHPYLVLILDRGGFDLEETIDRLQIRGRENIVGLEYCVDDLAIHAVKKAIEKRIGKARETGGPMLAVVFIEGIDIMVSDQNKMTPVASFIRALSRIAEYYHLAIIGSMGARKLMKKEDFASDRDALFGSSVFARMTSTVIRMTKKVDDETGAEVLRVIIMPRHSAIETYDMQFSPEGLLVVKEYVEGVDAPVGDSSVVAFAKKRHKAAAAGDPESRYWTRQEAEKATGLSRSAVNNQIAAAKGQIRLKPGPPKKHPRYTYWTAAETAAEGETGDGAATGHLEKGEIMREIPKNNLPAF